MLYLAEELSSRAALMTVPHSTRLSWRELRDKAGFKPEHAEAAAEALSDAVGGAELVTKTGLITGLRDLEQRLTIKLGGMLVVAVGVILAALRYMPAPHP
jgi:hypothetical protein